MNSPESLDSQPLEALIIGAGISGICIGRQLLQAGFKRIAIIEKSNDVSGTWLENSYPGCGCDVPAMLYSYSFAMKKDWTRKYALQPELLEYFRDCAEKFGLHPYLRLGQTVTQADWSDAEKLWLVKLQSGETLKTRVLISAVGQLNRPSIPSLPGMDSFQGPSFHSARWPKDFDPAGKRIAVIGSGASAIQIIPELAKTAAHTYVIQRSPNYIAPRNDHFYSSAARFLFKTVPGLAQLYRQYLFWSHEYLIYLYRKGSNWNRGFRSELVRKMRSRLPKALWRTVIPKYPAGCKRVLLSDNYLQSLSKENVTLCPEGAQGLTAEGVQLSDQTVPVDAVVYATGFESHPFLKSLQVTGLEGALLSEAWAERPKTYYGIATEAFPNLFMLYGPNTNLGHNTIIAMIESQSGLITQCLQAMQRKQAQSMEVKSEAIARYDAQLQENLSRLVWTEKCGNWYTDQTGHIVNNWSGTVTSYRRQTKQLREEDFQFS